MGSSLFRTWRFTKIGPGFNHDGMEVPLTDRRAWWNIFSCGVQFVDVHNKERIEWSASDRISSQWVRGSCLDIRRALYSFPYSTVEFLALPIAPGVETCSSARGNAVWVQPRVQLVGLKRWPSIRMNVRAHSKNRKQLRQTLNDGFRGYIRTRKAKGNLEYSSTTVIKYVTGSAWQQACEVQVQSFKNLRSFEKSSNIWSNEVGLYLLTFFTLRCHLSYVSESEWKMFGTNEVTHPRNAWMTESNVKTAQAVLLNITTVSLSQTVGTNIFYPRAMHNIVAIRRQLQPPPRDFDVFDFVGVSHVLHEWHTLLVSYKGKMLSNKQMPPLSKCFYHSVGLLFNGRMALFARR